MPPPPQARPNIEVYDPVFTDADAALLASLSCPQPAYVYALLLLSEFTQLTVPASLLVPLIPPGSSPTLEARKHLERAA